MNKKQVIKEVHDLVQEYCEDCFLYKHLRDTSNRKVAQQFCIKECSVGERLQEYGDQLSKKRISHEDLSL